MQSFREGTGPRLELVRRETEDLISNLIRSRHNKQTNKQTNRKNHTLRAQSFVFCGTQVVVGASGTGKSGLVMRFVANLYDPDFAPTIENRHKKRMKLGDCNQCEVHILDTGGGSNLTK